MVRYSPNEMFYRYPSGAVKQGETIKFNIEILREIFVHSVFLVLTKDGEDKVRYKMDWTDLNLGYDVFTLSITPGDIGLYFYYFEIDISDGSLYVGKNYLNKSRISVKDAAQFQLTIYDKNLKTPEWFKGGTMYHIFVDRFYRVKDTFIRDDVVFHSNWDDTPVFEPVNGKILNNDFFGGSLYGVIEKLDYLVSLNVTVIYLSPVFTANSNHKYDTGDYMNVDEMFGGNKALKQLIEECKKKNIKIILDGVFNHTGDDSIYFNKYGRYPGLGAYQSGESEYFSWYNFINFPDVYESWWGIETLPQTNENNKDYQEFITGKNGVVRKWVKEGIGGFRLDVVDELPDFFVEKIKAAQTAEKKDSILIGEVWEDASSKTAYGLRRKYLLGYELDSVMNYPLKSGILEFIKHGNSNAISSVMNLILDNYPKPVTDCLMNITGTHDTIRMITALATEQTLCSREDKAKFRLSETDYIAGVRKVKLASLLQFTLPGVPCIYYGDEIGMQGFEDPFNRGSFEWGRENKDLLYWYRFLGTLRKNKVFKDGGYREIYSDNGVFIFERFKGKKSVIIGVNCSSNTYKLETNKNFKKNKEKKILKLAPNGYIILPV